ncbi:MAG: PspA/IM30 family protein [bacterium]|jgi:phage shock protein A
MGFWKRLGRFFRALFGGAMSAVEDPEMMLRQTIDDMRAKIPRMNESLAKMKGGIVLLEDELKTYEADSAKMKATIKAALEAGDEIVAANYAVRLKSTLESMERTKAQIEQAQMAFNQAIDLRNEYKKEIEKKARDFERAVDEKRLAEFKKEVASAFESFQVGDADYTYKEMMDKLKRRTAEAEARLEVAMTGIDAEQYKIDRRAEEIEAKEILDQFRVEWGLSQEQKAADKTLGMAQPKEQEKQAE